MRVRHTIHRRIRVMMGSLAVSALALSAAAQQSDSIWARFDSPLRVTAAQEEAHVTTVTLDAMRYARMKSAEEVILTDFVVDRDRRVDLALTRVEAFSSDARIVLGTQNGDVPLAQPDVVLLSGYVVGHPGSLAFLGLSPHGSNGIVRADGETFVVSSGRHPRSGSARVYSLTAIPPGTIRWRDFHCAVDDAVAKGLRLESELQRRSVVPDHADSGTGVNWVVEMAIETDWEFTGSLFGGDTDASGAYAAMLVGAVSEVYMRDLSTQVVISFLRLWPDSNDPWNGSDTIDQLIQFENHWRFNMGGIQRDLAHFFSGRGLGGGVAYLGAICESYGYAVSANLGGYFPYPVEDNHSQNWDLMVVAHETGHNFGGPHTHDMNPAIDGCAFGDCRITPSGTIMSYCHLCSGGMANVLMQFHDRMINERIRPYLMGVGCDIAAGPPTFLDQPTDRTACLGGVAELSVLVSGQAPVSYQWRKDGVDLPGESGSTLTLDPVVPDIVGSYDVVASNALGSLTSQPAAIATTLCGAPEVPASGCRFLTVSPQPPDSTARVALQVSLPDYPCIAPKYADSAGRLQDRPVFRTSADWGTVEVSGSVLTPDTTYHVRADFGTLQSPRLSDPTSVVTSPWGDTVGEFTGTEWSPPDGVIRFVDVLALVDAFRHLPSAPPLSWGDIYPESPDGTITILDISSAIDGFKGSTYPFEQPQCP